MEELKPLEDAQTTLLKERDLKTFNLQDENEVLELLTVQKAQILRSSKLITKLRDKIARLDGEKTEALIKISNKEADIESLQEQYLSMQLQIDKIMSKLQLTEAEKTKLSEKYRNLYEELTSRNAYLQKRDEQLTDLVKLVTEIDLCVNEVGKLVELGQSLANGQEPSVATLLGLSEDLELHMQSLDSGVFNEDKAEDEELLVDDSSSSRRIISSRKASTLDPSDSEWVKSRTQKVRELRKNLSHLRDIANDLYTDVLGGNVEGCKVQ
jgi:predicted  nucleic acid-binding Zn-ribbon protein